MKLLSFGAICYQAIDKESSFLPLEQTANLADSPRGILRSTRLGSTQAFLSQGLAPQRQCALGHWANHVAELGLSVHVVKPDRVLACFQLKESHIVESNAGGRGWSEQRPEPCSLAGVTLTKIEWTDVTLVKNMYVSGVQHCTAVSVHATQMSLAGLGGWVRLREDCVALPHLLANLPGADL